MEDMSVERRDSFMHVTSFYNLDFVFAVLEWFRDIA